jgi:hypothetical protein
MEQIPSWNAGVDPTFDPFMATYNQDFGYDNVSQFEYNSSYAHSSAAPSEADYPQNRAPKGHYYDVPHQAMNRRESARSVAQPQAQYFDSAYHSAATISPAMDVNMDFFPTYPQNGQDFSQDFFMYAHLPANACMIDAASNNDHSTEQVAPESPEATSDGETSRSSIDSANPPRSHPLYNVGPHDDGLFHCPFAATEDCGHEPKMLKCEYDKYIDSHLKPFRCRSDKCSDLQFSSTACLLRHEREAHEMHGHEESLCEYPPCNRSLHGNGFRRSYNCKDHMTRCHGWVDTNPVDSKKRKSASGAGVAKVSKTKSAVKVMSKKQQVAQLRDEWAKRKAHLANLTHDLAPDGPLFAIACTQIQAEMQTLKSIQTEWSKLTGRTTIR